MPLEPVDLTSLDAYALKSKKDVMLINNDEKPFWMYKDFPIQDKGKAVKTVLVILVNRSKITSLLKGTLAASGTVSLKEGKISFTPDKGKVPYGLLKKLEPRLFGTKKILIPTGADVDEGEGESEGEPLAQGVGVGSGSTPQQVTTPKPVEQPQPQPTIPGMSPARVKFMQDFESAKPLLGQARAIVPDSVSGSLKAVLLQLPKISQQMNEATSKGEWAKASEFLKMMIEGATDVVEGKKTQDGAADEFKKTYAEFKNSIDGVAGLQNISAALKAEQIEVANITKRINAAAVNMDWAGAQKILGELRESIKKVIAHYDLFGKAKKKYTDDYNLIKGELATAVNAKPETLDQPSQQLQLTLKQAMKDLSTESTANNWIRASEIMAQVVLDTQKFTAAKQTNDGKNKAEVAWEKLKPQVEEALAIPPVELAGPLKPQQAVITNARNAVTKAIDEKDWGPADGALNTLKTELKKLVDGKRDQDLARRKYAGFYAKLGPKIKAVTDGPKTPPLDQLRKTCLDAHVLMEGKATALDFAGANLDAPTVDHDADAYLDAVNDAETRRSTSIGNAKQAALKDAEGDMAAAKGMPADDSVTDEVTNTVANSDVLTKSKGLQEILGLVNTINRNSKSAILSGAASRMGGVVTEIDAALEKIAKYQKDHKQTGDKDDKKKFEVSQKLKANLEKMKTALDGLAPVMRTVTTLENSGEEGIAKAAALLVGMLRQAKSPDVKTMLTQRYSELATRLSKPGDDDDRKREIARVMGGDKEKAFFEARYNPLQTDLQKADRITTVTKATEKARNHYKDLRENVESAVARGDWAAAASDLPKLKQATAAFLDLQAQTDTEAKERADRRKKASKAFGKATSQDEMEEIAKSMGGEVEASFRRQKLKGPMTTEGLAGKNLGTRHTATKLVDGASARNTEVARGLADRLISDDGELEVTALYMSDPEDLARTLGVSPNSKQLAKTLKKLKDDPQLAEKINSLGKPDPKNPACQMIRSSLGLGPDDEVTEVHARKAALSALLSELRQDDVGSCFATGTAIRVHDSDPGRVLDDLKQLIETGKMVRTVTKNGKTKTYEVPISLPVGGGVLAKKMKIKSNGNVTSVGGSNITEQHISATPTIAAGLSGLGLTPDKHRAAVNTALGNLQTSKKQAGKTALSGSLPDFIQDPSFPTDPTKKIPNATKKDLLARIPKLLAEEPDQVKARAALALEVDALPEKNAILAAFDNYFTAPDREFTPEDLVEQSALDQAEITEADLAARDRLDAMSLRLRSIRGMDPSTYDLPTQKLLNDYNVLSRTVSAKAAKYAKYDKLAGAGKNACSGQQDNRLLRAWEFSISAMADAGVSDQHGPAMKSAAVRQVQSITNVIGGREGDPLKAQQANDKVMAKFQELWDQSVRVGFDASRQGEVSADGNSSKGAFCLFDKAGIDDPGKHIPVNDKNGYTKLIEGLMARATQEVLNSEGDEDIAKIVKKMGSSVGDDMAKFSDHYVESGVEDLQTRGFTKYKEPWAVVDGHQLEASLESYYGQDVSAGLDKATPSNPQELTGFLLTSGRKLLSNIPDKNKLTPDTLIPMMGGPHAWSLRPGDPKVRKVLESPGDAQAFKDEEAAKYNKQQNEPLTPELAKMLLDDTFKDWPANMKNDVLQLIVSMPSAKASDIPLKVEQYFANNPNQNLRKFAETAHIRASTSVMKNVLPPIELAGGKLEAHVDEVLKKLNLGEGAARVKSTVMAQFNVPGQTPPTSCSMTDIEKRIAKAMKGNGIVQDEAQAAARVCRAQQPPPGPPGLPFGDSNWGGGDHHILFTMVRNPKTGELEMWQCNEDGSSPAKLKTDEWINGKKYAITTDPNLVGGLV